MTRAKVITTCVLTYGTTHMAWIRLYINQIWDIFCVPDDDRKVYTLRRRDVSIDVSEEDFKRIFREVEE